MPQAARRPATAPTPRAGCRSRGACMQQGICLAVVALNATAATQPATCQAPAKELLFCRHISHNVSSDVNTFAQDSAAKRTFDTVLNGFSSCQGLVLTVECQNAFRAYACAAALPSCRPASAPTATHVPPCRSMCDAYCKACRLSNCPCSDLPPDGGDRPCFTTRTPSLPPPRTSGAAAPRLAGEPAASGVTLVLTAISLSVGAQAVLA